MSVTTDFNLCLLLEDNPETQVYLEKILEQAFPGITVVKKSNLKDAKEWLAQPPSLAVVDLGLPDGSGVEVLKILKERFPDTASVVMTIYDDEARVFEALAAGATGYILKDDSPQSMIEILRRLRKNEPPLSPAIARRLISHFQVGKATTKADTSLSAREQETLALIAKGLTVPEAAKQMGLSAQTVAGYVKNVYQKLHICTRAEATREAIRRGLA